MNTLIVFLLGVIATMMAYPICYSLVDVFTTITELWKMKLSVKMAKCQSEIAKYTEDLDTSNSGCTHAIGFCAPEEIEEFEEDSE